MDPLLFQLIIAINSLLIGVVLVLGVQHARAHFRPQKPALPTQTATPQLRQQLMAKAEERYNSVLEQSAATLERNLNATTGELTRTLTEIGSDILDKETRLFGEKLTSLRQASQNMLDSANGSIAKQQAEVEAELQNYKTKLEQDMASKMNKREAEMTAELNAQKEELIASLDSKLTDTISAFLTETLGKEVDLGAQGPYLVAMLEERKDDLIKGVRDEA